MPGFSTFTESPNGLVTGVLVLEEDEVGPVKPFMFFPLGRRRSRARPPLRQIVVAILCMAR
jgi:hypothetical protein